MKENITNVFELMKTNARISGFTPGFFAGRREDSQNKK